MTAAPTMPTLPQADTRVILAGRTGLDATLRLDQTLELVRVATLTDAVAEVALPLPDQPAKVTVVVGADLVREAGQSRLQRLCEQLRASNPGVRVLVSQVGELPGDFKPGSWGFDDAVGSESPASDVRSRMRTMTEGQGNSAVNAKAAAAPAPASFAGVPVAQVKSAATAISGTSAISVATVAREAAASKPAASAAPAGMKLVAPVHDVATAASAAVLASVQAASGQGDSLLVAELLRGGDVTTAALMMLRERLHDASVEFIAGEVDAKSVMASGANTARVGWDEATYGMLRSQRTASEQLLASARWLAGWLRLQDQQNQLREAAFTDALTGTHNRRYFDLFAARALGAAREKRQFITMLLFDIDNFKQYNDLYGHDAGDDILVEVSRLMRAVVRPTDRVCRLGGDEFAVIFHDPQGPRQEGSRHPSDVCDIATRFQQQVSEHKFPKLADKAQGTLTISGGLATYPWDGQTPAELLAHADKLLLQSKKAGKNAITLGPGALR